MSRFNLEHDLIFEAARQAWTLSDDELDQIKPGSAGVKQAIDLLLPTGPVSGPLTSLTRDQLDDLPVNILKIMRDPLWFPFTCRNLFVRPDGAGPLELLPFQHLALQELWWRQFPMLIASRGAGKSFILALYALLRATFTPGAKVIITAAAFRQAKAVFEYMERFWYNSPVFRTLVNSGPGGAGRKNGPRRDIDRVEFIIGDSVIIGLPIGNGEKIRGLRANYILTDEVAALNEEVYAVVVQGFASVTADPIGNVKDMARIRLLKRLALWTDEMDADERKRVRGNQSVLSGTAHYAFNHFYKYWHEYTQILRTGGDKSKLEEVLKGPVPDGYNWRDYSVFRLSYDLVPHGYMDEKTIIRARQITNKGQFAREYGATFVQDSDGFFRRSLIERCVVGRIDDTNPPTFPSCQGPIAFTAALSGDPERKYVFGIDPASERDQFAVKILEVWPDHRRVVYGWTTSKSDHVRRRKAKVADEHDFYRFCVRKIRDLMKVFPCERLMVDHGGGGIALREALGDPDKLKEGELPIYEVRAEPGSKPNPTDELPGLHIIELVKFRDTAWVTEANEGLKKDLEDRVLLFPLIDPLALGLAEAEDLAVGRVEQDDEGNPYLSRYDSLETCMMEIEELKEELTTIVVTTTPTGLAHWDTPDKKVEGQKAGRMRKDRYSALLMANMGARKLARALTVDDYSGVLGGFTSAFNFSKSEKSSGNLYKSNQRFMNHVGEGAWYGRVISRSGV